jgi:hypothetical protein
MTGRHLLAAFTAAIVPLGAAVAQPPQAAAGEARPALFEALVHCRTITDDAARLRCFDAASAALDQAAERRDLVVVDRAQVHETRRRLFGLSLPDLPIFGHGSHDEEETITAIDGTVRTASQQGYGQWVVTLADGSTWVQTDSHTLALRPRAGQPVHISRGALGSYIMRVNNQPGIRVRRQM